MADRDINVRFTGDTDDLERASRRAGDTLEDTGKTSQGIFKKLTGGAADTAAALGMYGQAAAGAAEFAWGFLEAAMGDAAAADSLAQNLRTAAGATDEAIAGAENYIAALSQQMAIADDELRPALSRLALTTGDTAKAQELLALATDISAGTGKDLGTVAEALAKAQTGQTKGLVGLGIATKDAAGETLTFDQILAGAQAQFKGAGEAAANTAEGGLKKFQIGLGEMQEAIGAKLLPAFSALMGFVNDKVMPLLAEAWEAISAGFSVAAELVGQVWANVVARAAPLFDRLAEIAGQVFTLLVDGWAEVSAFWATNGDAILDTLATIAGFLGNVLGAAFDKLIAAAVWVIDLHVKLWSAWGREIMAVFSTVVDKVGPVLAEIVGGFKAFVAAFQSADGDVTSSGFAGFMERLANTARTVVDAVGPALQTVSDAVRLFVGAFTGEGAEVGSITGEWVNRIIDLGAAARGVFDKLQSGIAAVGQWWTEHSDQIMSAIGTVATYLSTTVTDAFGKFVEIVRWVIDQASGFWAEWGDEILSAVGAVASFLGTTGKAAFEGLVTVVRWVIDNVGGFWAEWGDEIVGTIVTVAQTIGSFVQGIIDFAQALGDRLREFWAAHGADIMTFVNAVVELFGALVARVQPALDTLVTIFGIAFEIIKAVVTVVIGTIAGILYAGFVIIRTVVSTAVSVIQRIWEVWGDTIMAVIDRVMKIVGDIIRFGFDLVVNIIRFVTSLLKGDWAAAWETVKDTVRLGVQFIDDIMSKIGGFVVAALRGVADLITAPFRAAFNSIADLWNSTVGKLSFTLPEWIPGIGGRGFDVPDIPRMGTFSSLTLVMPPGTDGYDVARQVATFSRGVAPLTAAVSVR